METQQSVPFVLLLTYKLTVNNIKVFSVATEKQKMGSLCTVKLQIIS
jgi:hypothetical protein